MVHLHSCAQNMGMCADMSYRSSRSNKHPQHFSIGHDLPVDGTFEASTNVALHATRKSAFLQNSSYSTDLVSGPRWMDVVVH